MQGLQTFYMHFLMSVPSLASAAQIVHAIDVPAVGAIQHSVSLDRQTHLVKRMLPSVAHPQLASGTVKPYNAGRPGEYIRKAALHRLQDPVALIGKGQKTYWTQQKKWMDRARASYEGHPRLVHEQVRYYDDRMTDAKTQQEYHQALAKATGWIGRAGETGKIKDASHLALGKVQQKMDHWNKERNIARMEGRSDAIETEKYQKWKMRRGTLVGNAGKNVPPDAPYAEWNADRLLHKYAAMLRDQSAAPAKDHDLTDAELKEQQKIQGKMASLSMQALGWHAAAANVRAAQEKAAAEAQAAASRKRRAGHLERGEPSKKQATTKSQSPDDMMID